MYSKLYSILGKKNKNKIFFFLFLNLIYFFLEFASLASLPFFVSFIIDPNYIIDKLNIYFNKYNFTETNFNILLLFFSILIIIIFFLKNFFLIFITYLQNNFLKKIKVEFANIFFSFYINSPYLYHVNNNPSKLSRNISSEIQSLYIYFFHLSGLIRDSLTILVIFIFLTFLNLYLTLSIVFFFFYYFIFLPKICQIFYK